MIQLLLLLVRTERMVHGPPRHREQLAPVPPEGLGGDPELSAEGAAEHALVVRTQDKWNLAVHKVSMVSMS